MSTTTPQKERFLLKYLKGNDQATQIMAIDAVRKKFGTGVAPNVVSILKRRLEAQAAEKKERPFKVKQGWKDSKVKVQETPRVIDIRKIADTNDEENKQRIITLAKEIRSLLQDSKTLKGVRIGEKEIDIQVLRLETERIGDDPVEQSEPAVEAQS